MTKHKVTLSGCDDSTTFEMDVTDSEMDLLNQMVELSNKHSRYGCCPTMVLDDPYNEVDEPSEKDQD